MISPKSLMITSLLFALCSLPVAALSPAEAAQEARSRTGGKVLKVKARDAKSYRVKVLMPNGQVRHVTIQGNNTKSKHTK